MSNQHMDQLLDSMANLQIDNEDEKNNDILKIAQLIQNSTNIIIMVGAGISVSCGIPDFRTPGTDLYDNLQKYNLPKPEAIFDIDYFRENPKPFRILSKELDTCPTITPSLTHEFIRVLEEKSISADKVVQAHGGFGPTETCIECHTINPKSNDEADDVPRCFKCNGLTKPDIVFFGEDLPARFYERLVDFSKADLLIVMGTSLTVRPFCHQINAVPKSTTRILINNQRVGEILPGDSSVGFRFDGTRDIFYQSDTDTWAKQMFVVLKWNIKKT